VPASRSSNLRRSFDGFHDPIFAEVIRIISLRREPNNLKPDYIRIIREPEGRDLVFVRISNVECIGFGDDHPVTFVEHFLGDAVMPCLYNPILGQIDCLLFVCQRIVPQNQRFAWQKVFEPLQERLEQLVVVISLPDICYFIAAKVMHRRPEIAVDSGDQIGDVVVGVPMPDVQLCIWSFQICLAYYQVLVPYSP
jgi:hypothetical protein